MTYVLLEFVLCAMVVVAIGTLLFLVAVSLVAVAKGAIMFARLVRKVSSEAAVPLPLRASSERAQTSG